ncbi:aminoglycoside phosphotransferase family protein [Oryzobacter sp. R7]|uniref:aminoglycoside phosphotransferase family protein n=1 Tax=Oryzobacter faecalis TaxID=3388656 RepID=UPI00398D4F09
MASSAPPRRVAADPAGEAAVLALLTGPDAADVLEAVLATAGGARARHEVHRVEHRPGDGVTVGYRVWVRAAGVPDAAAEVAAPASAPTPTSDAVPTAEEYVLVSSTAGRDVPDDAPGVARLEGPSGRLVAWRHPDDPAIPALGAGCDPTRLEDVLPGAGPVTALELVGYRPLRRAVLRAERAGRTHWVKVLRPGAGPGRALDVVDRHERLRDAGLPVPRVLASTSDGLVVLEHLHGTPLLAAIGEDDAQGFGALDAAALLDRLPADAVRLPRRPAWADRVDLYAAALAAADGTRTSNGATSRAAHLARVVRERSERLDLGPVVPTHGDLHAAQLMVERADDRWVVNGLLDVDTVGPGHRVDDLACLVAHAVAMGEPGARVAARWEDEAATLTDPHALAVRTAGVLLSLAAGALHGHGPTGVDELLDAAEARLTR